jgi:hypothetical protein
VGHLIDARAYSLPMHPRRVRPLAGDELKRLTTDRLLADRTKLLGLEESVEKSDLTAAEVAELPTGFLYFKDDPAWREHYGVVKTILADREHVE